MALAHWQEPRTKFRAVATDYDGTLARNGKVQPETLRALSRVRLSGRRVILLTGREISSLKQVMPQLEVFDLIVAENGAVLYSPFSRTEAPLAKAPVPEFVKRLQEEGVQPLSVGTLIIATLRVHQKTVLRLIRKLDLNLEVSMNRGSMMILPSGVDKGTGLEAALGSLAIEFLEVVGIGDAENDIGFLGRCGWSVAVGNALPKVKAIVDLVLDSECRCLRLHRSLRMGRTPFVLSRKKRPWSCVCQPVSRGVLVSLWVREAKCTLPL